MSAEVSCHSLLLTSCVVGRLPRSVRTVLLMASVIDKHIRKFTAGLLCPTIPTVIVLAIIMTEGNG